MNAAQVSTQAFAWAEIVATLQGLKDGQPACIPQYDFVTSSRTSEPTPVESADVILFDGILAFCSAGEVHPVLCQKLQVAVTAAAVEPLHSLCTKQGISAIMQQSRAGRGS